MRSLLLLDPKINPGKDLFRALRMQIGWVLPDGLLFFKDYQAEPFCSPSALTHRRAKLVSHFANTQDPVRRAQSSFTVI
jgi:hypothetical protein